ncbi:MAG: hypothetical protein LBF15_02240 [Candidatus Peribacteria bacterium]|jgi:hypothetical protein|nr:hypothetical protein [Candidatus Peribacteria bacterium]
MKFEVLTISCVIAGSATQVSAKAAVIFGTTKVSKKDAIAIVITINTLG